MLGKVLDESKLEQIKRIMDDTDKTDSKLTETSSILDDIPPLPDNIAMPNNTDDESDVTSVAESDHSVARKKPIKRRNELQKLNDDIRDMFISNGVLSATGRRMCTVLGKPNEDIKSEPTEDESNTPKISEGMFLYVGIIELFYFVFFLVYESS